MSRVLVARVGDGRGRRTRVTRARALCRAQRQRVVVQKDKRSAHHGLVSAVVELHLRLNYSIARAYSQLTRCLPMSRAQTELNDRTPFRCHRRSVQISCDSFDPIDGTACPLVSLPTFLRETLRWRRLRERRSPRFLFPGWVHQLGRFASHPRREKERAVNKGVGKFEMARNPRAPYYAERCTFMRPSGSPKGDNVPQRDLSAHCDERDASEFR